MGDLIEPQWTQKYTKDMGWGGGVWKNRQLAENRTFKVRPQIDAYAYSMPGHFLLPCAA